MSTLTEVIEAKAVAEVAEELVTKLRATCQTMAIDFRVDEELRAHSDMALTHLHIVLIELTAVLKYWPAIPPEKGC